MIQTATRTFPTETPARSAIARIVADSSPTSSNCESVASNRLRLLLPLEHSTPTDLGEHPDVREVDRTQDQCHGADPRGHHFEDIVRCFDPCIGLEEQGDIAQVEEREKPTTNS